VARTDSQRSSGQYRAFLSYSHADTQVVDWLHGALEGYRIPSKLVGELTPLGPVPARLGKLFRDRDELPAAGDLSAELKGALKKSMFLIVVCSPAAAQSRWVNEEVRQFKLLHGHKRGDGTARVLALIVDGDPADPEGGDCFPPALKFHVLPDGSISDDPAEPIAADIRPGGDGKKLAKLKLVAGLTGLPLDALVQREAARRQRRAALMTGASLALTAVMAVLTVLAVQGRREAERQRAQADGLIEYMLTDLRKKLEPVGRLEVMDSVGQRALAYYAAQNLAGLTPDELGRRARALHLVGEVRDLRGDGEGALKAFREAERTTAELLARDSDNPDRMFDHAQSVFYVGQVALMRKDWPAAEARFRRYVELADGMAATDPDNPKWIAEQAYATNALGVLLLRQQNPVAAAAQFQRYVEQTGRLMQLTPDDPGRIWEHGQAHAWLADAYSDQGRWADARAARLAELKAYSDQFLTDPKDARAWQSYVVAQDVLAGLALATGDVGEAVDRSRVGTDAIHALLAEDPGNMSWLDSAVSLAIMRSEALLLDGDIEGASRSIDWAVENGQRLAARDPANLSVRQRLIRAHCIEIALAHQRGDRAEARRLDAAFRARFPVGVDPSSALLGESSRVLVDTMAAFDALAQGNRAEAQRLRASALSIPAPVADPRRVAAIRALNQPPFADGRTGGGSAGSEKGYPLDRLLAPIRAP
jgi:tetratricopeptide (TPR) repeat protein